MSINVLFVHGGTLEKAGTEAYMMNVFRQAKAFDIHIDFLVFGCTKGFYDEEVLRSGSIIYRIPYRPIDLKDKHQSIKSIIKTIKEKEYDILHSHMNALNHLVFRFFKNMNIGSFISHSHANKHFVENKWLIKFKEHQKTKIKKDADLMIACSKEAGEFLYGNQPFIVLKNGIDLNLFDYKEKTRETMRKTLGLDESFVVGHAGRFTFEKNHDFLLEVFKRLKEEKNNAELLLLGTGPLVNEVQQKAIAMGIHDSVHFMGVIDNIEDYYQAMDAFLLPSLFEGLGYVLIEAQSSGLFCIASTQVPRLSQVSDNIAYLPIDDPKPWVDSLLNHNYKARKSQAEAIKDQGFDEKTDVYKLFNIYESLSKKARNH